MHTTDSTTTAAIDPGQSGFDPATVDIADLTDAQIERLVREDARGAEVLVARVLGYTKVDDECGQHPEYLSRAFLPRPLTDPAAAWNLLEWARAAFPVRGCH